MNGDSEIENIHVFIRIRPFNKREIEKKCEKVTLVDPKQQQIVVKKPGPSVNLCKAYTFDSVIPEDCTQTEVYYRTSHSVVDKVLQGYNGTIFAYGQTGTGKTYTMSGLRSSREERGIMPNTFTHIFNHISNAKSEITFLVHVTYLEIYNENVRDLLAKFSGKPSNLEVREHSEFGVFVENLSGYIVNNIEELERILDIGQKNRVVSTTDMNITSSRSHTIFTITIESSNKRIKEGKFTRGKLHLVDLAGSERQHKSHVSGIQLKEATKINQSLFVLGNVISALVDGKANHIPYRNSKLTRLLQDSLGGNSKTIMITTVSPSEHDYDETISSLRYANRAKNIQNRTHVNEQAKDTLLRSFQAEIEELRNQLNNLNTEIMQSKSENDITKKIERSRKLSRKKSSSEMSTEYDTLDEIDIENVTEEIFKAREESRKLRDKLIKLKNKILTGGQNFEQSEEHNENMLKCAQSKIDNSIKRQEELKQCLKQYEEDRIIMAKKYSSAQDEIYSKTKQLQKLDSHITNAKSELADLQLEQEEEMENILDSLKDMNRELQLNKLLIDTYIPPEYQTLIKNNIKWHEDIGEYHLKFVAHTGNNLKKQQIKLKSKKIENVLPAYNYPYRQYNRSARKTATSTNQTKSTSFKLPNICAKTV